jgi:hypothetical protein
MHVIAQQKGGDLYMRWRRRYLVLACACVAALVVGGAAFANHVSNVSNLPTWKVSPANLPNGTNFANAQLEVQTATVYAHPNDEPQGGKARTVTLLFDNDIRVRLQGIPSCTANFGSGTTIAAAWERCGPGADTAPERNAFLSPSSGVSGTTSTAPPSNFGGCNLVFKRDNDSILLFARVTLQPNAPPNCANPANNSGGNTSVTLIGNLSTVNVPDFRTRFRVPNIDQLALPLDDFKSRVKRGGVFGARCRDSNNRLGLRVNWVYSGSGQAPDTVTKQSVCS